MHDRGKIIAGLIVFLVLVTYPVWSNLAGGETDFEPKLKVPAGVTECVAPADYMRTSHMDLLSDWRDRVVREGQRVYIDNNGIAHRMSLTGTCLGCHSNKSEFCDQCHGYIGVEPNCWDCHNDPEETG